MMKGDSHNYLTSHLEAHEELFHSPHLKLFYSNSFKAVLAASKQFCADLSNARLTESQSALDMLPPDSNKRKILAQ